MQNLNFFIKIAYHISNNVELFIRQINRNYSS